MHLQVPMTREHLGTTSLATHEKNKRLLGFEETIEYSFFKTVILKTTTCDMKNCDILCYILKTCDVCYTCDIED